MDFTHHLAVSYYKTIAVINEAHKIYLVQHQETHKIFIKKILDVYNTDIYEYLYLHPIAGIPKIIAFNEENNQLTVIEDYISGSSLEDKIRQHNLSISDIASYMTDLCTVLQPLHHADPPIVHRDIKPSNIIINCWNHAVLLDFNAAKFFSKNSTEDTILLGTQGYAAPEQYGFGSSSPQTDIYSLGILLKEMTTSLSDPCHLFDHAIETCTKLKASERYESVNDLKKYMETLFKPQRSLKFPTCIQKYYLPGYRSHTPWKIFLASAYYLFVTWLCISFNVKDTRGFALFSYRICTLGIMLSWVFSCFNYRNIQCLIPLCKQKNRFLRYLGIIILNTVIVFSLFVILFISEELCLALS